LQHQLLAWELIGDARRLEFAEAAKNYVAFYREHMRVEEAQLLPVAQKVLTDNDWAVLDAAFQRSRDPLAGGSYDPCYDRLFTRIVTRAPAPVGVGAA
jgi:hemerythrin-like domain-containing protein